MRKNILISFLVLIGIFYCTGVASAAIVDYPEYYTDQQPSKIWKITFTHEPDPATLTDNIFVSTDSLGNNKVDGVIVSIDPTNAKCVLVELTGVEGWDSMGTYYLFITDNVSSTTSTRLTNSVRMKFSIMNAAFIPESIRGLKGTVVNTNQIKLVLPSRYIGSRIIVYRKDSENGSFVRIGSTTWTGEYVDVDLLKPHTYWYKVSNDWGTQVQNWFSSPIKCVIK